MNLLLDSLCNTPVATYRYELDVDSAENLESWVPKGTLLIYLGPAKSRPVKTAAGVEYQMMREFVANASAVAAVAADEGDGWKIFDTDYEVHESEPVYDPMALGATSHVKGYVKSLSEEREPLPAAS